MLLFFNYGRPICKGVIYPVQASPSSSPSTHIARFIIFDIAGISLSRPVF